ncbi:MAG: phosphoribosylformylglycinamidine cyclo-ligase [Ruminococcaceae bacterium]|nr:phosphoribosylformylglycinamidine cyclo-ligase [Oscillospiraceae bacterium]
MANYKDAGVDVEAGYESVRLMRDHVKKTYRPEVLTDIGGFGSLFQLDLSKYKEPVLVSGTDGVGTKLKLAFVMNKVDTVGQDCVAMCVNDVVCSGAEPLFFLDYIAVGKNEPQVIADIVKGVANACVETGCSLVGGETAEMPGFYKIDEFDLAGFAVACVDKSKIINGSTIKAGDVLIGLPSSGVHSNGFSLVRKVFEPIEDTYTKYEEELGAPLGEVLLTPTKLYVKPVLDLIEKFNIKGISHITGGGFYENIPRMGSKDLGWKINKGTWPILPIFDLIKKVGDVEEKGMFNTFNMGIGMIMAVDAKDADAIVEYLASKGEKSYIIGEVTEGNGEVTIC